jgi:hypothetical protein
MSNAERPYIPTPKDIFAKPTEQEAARNQVYDKVKEFINEPLKPERLTVLTDYATYLSAETTIEKAQGHVVVSREDLEGARATKAVVGHLINTQENTSIRYSLARETFKDTFEDKLIAAEMAILPADNNVTRLLAKSAVAEKLLDIRQDYIKQRNKRHTS